MRNTTKKQSTGTTKQPRKSYQSDIADIRRRLAEVESRLTDRERQWIIDHAIWVPDNSTAAAK